MLTRGFPASLHLQFLTVFSLVFVKTGTRVVARGGRLSASTPVLARLCLTLVDILLAECPSPSRIAQASVTVDTILANTAVRANVANALVNVHLTDGAGEARWTSALELFTRENAFSAILALLLVAEDTLAHCHIIALLYLKLLRRCRVDEFLFCEEGKQDAADPHLLHAAAEVSNTLSKAPAANNNTCVLDEVHQRDHCAVFT